MFDVAVDVDVTTVPDASNWLAPSAVIIDTSLTVAPLMKISSAAEFIWNKDLHFLNKILSFRIIREV